MDGPVGGSRASGGNGMVSNQANDTTTVAADDPKQNLNQVINSVQKTLGLLHQLYLTVSSFNAASQLPLLQRLYFSRKPTLSILFVILGWLHFCLIRFFVFAAILLFRSLTTWLNCLRSAIFKCPRKCLSEFVLSFMFFCLLGDLILTT